MYKKYIQHKIQRVCNIVPVSFLLNVVWKGCISEVNFSPIFILYQILLLVVLDMLSRDEHYKELTFYLEWILVPKDNIKRKKRRKQNEVEIFAYYQLSGKISEKKKRDLQSDWHSLNKPHLTQSLISTCNNSHDIWFRLQSQLFISAVFRLTSEFD